MFTKGFIIYSCRTVMNFYYYDVSDALDKIINFIFCRYHFRSTIFLRRELRINYSWNLFFYVFRFEFFTSNPSLRCFYYLFAYLLSPKTLVAFSKTTNACRISFYLSLFFACCLSYFWYLFLLIWFEVFLSIV